jgi:glycosyltransferase involved in cell wall biosynthesis
VSFPLDGFNRLGYTTKRVTAVVAVSESIKRGLISRGVPADKIAVIYSGTDTERFTPAWTAFACAASSAWDPSTTLVTQVGLRSQKGNDDTLDAMKIVAAKAPQARLLFVGANEAKAAIFREKAAARGLSDRMLILSLP